MTRTTTDAGAAGPARRITLIRHAQALSAAPGQTDIARPLSQRGQREAQAMAAALRERQPLPARLLASPALRTMTTAQIFASALQLSAADIQPVHEIYEASPQALLSVLRRQEDAERHLILFGHNPGFSQLALLLAPCPFQELPTGAVVQLDFALAHWQQLGRGSGVLAFWRFPEHLT